MSRAEVSAIERGRLNPSTATALRLGAALERRVEELFVLEGAEDSEASWAWQPGRSAGRFWEAEVGGRKLLFPVEATSMGSLPHDGAFRRDGLVRSPAAEAGRTLVVAGCDPAVGLLAAELARREGVRLLPLTRGSRDALELLRRGLVHAAGVHWSSEGGGDANASVVESALGPGFRLAHLARWQEGVALTGSVRARSAGALARARLRWVAREEGSGARLLLDRLLGARSARCRHVARDHRAVALAIASGYAQAGVAVRLAAEEAGLRFFAVQREDYELCFREDLADEAPLAALRRILRSADLKSRLGDLPGYEVSRTGEERTVAA